jgi:hypothetical protein
LEEQVDEVNAVTVEQGFPFWDALAMIYRGWLRKLSARFVETFQKISSSTSAAASPRPAGRTRKRLVIDLARGGHHGVSGCCLSSPGDNGPGAPIAT